MVLSVKHAFQTAIADDPAHDVSANEWNADHGLTGTLDIANGGTGTTVGVTFVSDTAPVGAPQNSLWFESDTGVLYIRYNDGTSTQWVQAVAIPSAATFVQKSGDTMTGPLAVPPNGSLFGGPNGSYAVKADANILFYNVSADNWCGMGTNTAGQWWLRTGVSGTPAAALIVDEIQNVHLNNAPTAAAHAVRKDYVDARIAATAVKIRVITASGTYTPDPYLIAAIIECIGGGGGGGGPVGAADWFIQSGGGGSGGYSRKLLTKAQIGASQPVTIGGAGTGGVGGYGTTGGQTVFGSSVCVANGGAGGAHFPYGGGGGGVGVGDVAIQGSVGTAGVYGGIGAGYLGWGGGGAPGPFGGGGAPGQANYNSAMNGVTATGYGAGGGAGCAYHYAANVGGGHGAPGVCIITEFCSQ